MEKKEKEKEKEKEKRRRKEKKRERGGGDNGDESQCGVCGGKGVRDIPVSEMKE